eukprot:4547791-Amphidinium_carterae.2
MQSSWGSRSSAPTLVAVHLQYASVRCICVSVASPPIGVNYVVHPGSRYELDGCPFVLDMPIPLNVR